MQTKRLRQTAHCAQARHLPKQNNSTKILDLLSTLPTREAKLEAITAELMNPDLARLGVDDLFRYHPSITVEAFDRVEREFKTWPDQAAANLTKRNNEGLTVFQQSLYIAWLYPRSVPENFLNRLLESAAKSKQGTQQILLALTGCDKKGKTGQEYLKAYANSKNGIRNNDKGSRPPSITETSSEKSDESKSDSASVSKKSSDSEIKTVQIQITKNYFKKTIVDLFIESLDLQSEASLLELQKKIQSAKFDKKSIFHKLYDKESFLYRIFSCSKNQDDRLIIEDILQALQNKIKSFSDEDTQVVRFHSQPMIEMQVMRV